MRYFQPCAQLFWQIHFPLLRIERLAQFWNPIHRGDHFESRRQGASDQPPKRHIAALRAERYQVFDRQHRTFLVMTKSSQLNIDFNSLKSRQTKARDFPSVAAHPLSAAELGRHVP